MKKTVLLPKAIALAALIAVGAAQAAVVTSMETVPGVDSLTFVDAREGNAKGTLSNELKGVRNTFESKLVAERQRENFSTAPYAPRQDGDFVVVDPLTGDIGAFGRPGALILDTGVGAADEYYVQTALTGAGAGRFDPTSTDSCTGAVADCTARWFEASGDFTIDFGGEGYGAFGFYGTDFGDFKGSLTMWLLKEGGGEVKIELAAFQDSDNGALGFFGFYDTVNFYTGVRFDLTQIPGQQPDLFGFDDLVLGQVADTNPNPNPVPEPGSLALVGASLLALTVARRRRNGRASPTA